MPLQAHYRVPATTAQLGTVLDLRIDQGATRLFLYSDWSGWLLLTDADAMERDKPRLYLVAFNGYGDAGDAAPDSAAVETVERWNKRGYDFIADVDVSGDDMGYRQGRVMSIGYRSDKWGDAGDFHDYDHDFGEGGGAPPLIYTDRADIALAKAAVIVGGDFQVTERGID